MNTLDDYLTGSYLTDIRDISSVEKIIIEVCKTLTSTFDAEKGWPYAVDRKKEIEFGVISHSTTSMVSLSIWKLLEKWKRPTQPGKLSVFPGVELPDGDDVNSIAKSSFIVLSNDIIKNGAVSTFSGSYGKDDPITLYFLANLCDVDYIKASDKYEEVRRFVRNSVEYLLKKGIDGTFKIDGVFKELSAEIGNYAVDNAIIPLRIVQSSNTIDGDNSERLHNFRIYFEKNLHEQLSFSSIPDSRFDPAELAFCLEGLLLVQQDAVDRTLFNRVLEVLTKAQEQSAFWRPVKPFMANSKGFSLFPVSVEVANSLLRSCELYDQNALHETFGSRSIPLLRRYWQWLSARIVRFKKNGKDYVGWHSEHINETDSIHIWETSQVLEFLLNYRTALQAHIARTTLVLSRFSVREPKKEKWSDLAKKYEPVTALGRTYSAYKEIGVDFVSGWEQRHPERFSMLLFGPPGTGKTTVAESISDALGVRMITITVSDFLAAGGAQLEARAKAIFDVLLAQSGVVVLFDEIDNFLLDRDGKRYSKQDSVFQFMTPGMLTKFNELRRSERVLFVIATNYENRIDSAIKRTGRVDKRYLVLPPDAGARRRILSFLIKSKLGPGVESGIADDGWESLERASVFLGYKDMEAVVIESMKGGGGEPISRLVTKLTDRSRTISPPSYASKFDKTPEAMDNSYPLEEFFALLALATEVNQDLSDADLKPSLIAAKAAMVGLGSFDECFPDLAKGSAGGKIRDALEAT